MKTDWRAVIERSDAAERVISDNVTVTFGRHAGEPVKFLLFDPGYCDWMLSTPDLLARHPELARWLRLRYQIPRDRELLRARTEHARRCAETALRVVGECEWDAGLRLRDLAPRVERAAGLGEIRARMLLDWLERHGAIMRDIVPGNRIRFLTAGHCVPWPDPDALALEQAEREGARGLYQERRAARGDREWEPTEEERAERLEALERRLGLGPGESAVGGPRC